MCALQKVKNHGAVQVYCIWKYPVGTIWREACFFFLFLFGHDSNMVMTHGSSKPDASVLLATAPTMQGCVYGDIIVCEKNMRVK